LIVDEGELGFGWLDPGDKLERCSHALLVEEKVWLVDAVFAEGMVERVRALGELAGVIQLLDRHGRDCAAWSDGLGVPLHVVPPGRVPFEVVPVVRSRWWREVALWWPERRTLVCGDALGTAAYFRAGAERLAVHPILRLRPPRRLGGLEPEHVLCGHGAGIHDDAPAAVREALATARRRLPHAWLGAIRRG
jgi:hypothetical protein